MTLERSVESYLKQCVERFGGRALKLQGAGLRGWPDRLVLVHGQVWFVELKCPAILGRAAQNRTPRYQPLQRRRGQWLVERRYNYALLTTRQEVDEWLTRIRM